MASTNVDLILDPITLPRAGRYSAPGDEGDVLPIVYGDLTDGSGGIWKAPRIDTGGSGTYCLAGHAVLSVGNGNSVTLYDDDGLIPGGEYTFSESNDFQSLGAIATAVFTTAPKGAVRVRMKGKNSGATLIENPITQLENFIAVHLGFASAIFNTTFLEESRARADAYKGAGVVRFDTSAAEFTQKILAILLADSG